MPKLTDLIPKPDLTSVNTGLDPCPTSKLVQMHGLPASPLPAEPGGVDSITNQWWRPDGDGIGRPISGDVLRELFNEYGPCLILIDEWVAYTRQLHKESDRRPVFSRPGEVTKLFEVLSSTTIGPLVRSLLCTGTRIGEVRGLRWQDLDIDACDPDNGSTLPLVRIRGQLQRIDGKLTYRPTTKTNQDRVLPLPLFLAAELRLLKEQQVTIGVVDPDGIVFLNPEGSDWMRSTSAIASRRLAVELALPP